MLRPQLGGTFETYGLSNALWSNVPLEYIFGFKDRSYGLGLIDNFVSLGQAAALSSSLGRYVSNGIAYRSYELFGGTSAAGISAKTPAAARPGGIVLGTSTSDNDECSLQAGSISATGSIVPFAMVPDTHNDLYFECSFKVSSITTAIYSMFVGLAGTGGAVTNMPISAADVIGSMSAIGFSKLQAGTSSLSLAYNRASGTPGAMTGVATLVADTYVKAGFKWQRKGNMVIPYINGLALDGVTGNNKVITSATTAATPWPNDYMTLCAGLRNYTTTAVQLTLDWWAVAQVAA